MSGRSKKIAWPPKRLPAKYEKKVRAMRDGEPNTIQLTRFETDMSLRASIDNACCKCGLRHLLVFEVFRDAAGRFYLNKRSYRLDGHD